MRTLLCFMSLAHVVALGAALLTRTSVPPGWTVHRRADPNAVLPLRIVLIQPNLHNLDSYLFDVSDPQSPNYGQHWTFDRVAETFRPSEESVDVIRSWLVDDRGADLNRVKLSADGSVFMLNVTVAEAESMFETEYNVYRWRGEDTEEVGCHLGLNLPEHVSKHVDFIWPTLPFGKPMLSRRDSSPKLGMRRPTGAPTVAIEETQIYSGIDHCDTAVTLECLRALYNFDYELVSAEKNTVAIAEFGLNSYLPSDLDMFFEKFAPDQVGNQPTLISIAGGHLNVSDTSIDNVEGDLDFELLMGLLGREQEVLLYKVGTDNDFTNSGDELLGAIDASYCSVPGVSELGLKDCGNKPGANVISISYTSLPDIQDPDVLPLLIRQCAEIGKLALTGLTAVVSSGDTGVSFGQAGEGMCLVNGTLVEGNQTGTFVGSFPASCPYVTAVGATSVSPGKTVYDPEIATTAFPSGGGFSNAFERPSFQDYAVTSYLDRFAPPYESDVFNRSGRGFPDVSANGWPTVIVLNGSLTLSGGTSASAPIFASFIAAINDARLAVGKGPVGWINPALYSQAFAWAFNDVINGTNPGCGTEGFPAAPGWDPVTGLGTPNFERLLSSFLLLP